MAAKDSVDLSDLAKLTRAATLKQSTVAFAGILVGENKNSISVADPQGTWVIDRGDVVSLDDWEHGDCAPPYMREQGRPVRVVISDGTTIHEVRPWRIDRGGGGVGQDRTTRMVVDSIFTLGGDAAPVVPPVPPMPPESAARAWPATSAQAASIASSAIATAIDGALGRLVRISWVRLTSRSALVGFRG